MDPNKNTLTVRQDGQKVTIPITAPKPRVDGDKVVAHTDKGTERFRDKDVVGWQWDGSTH